MQINEIELLGLDIPPDTTEMLVADSDNIVYSIPITDAVKPTLLATKESPQNFMSENTGAVSYASISEVILLPAINTKYAVEIMLYIQDTGSNEHPFAIKVHSNAEWSSSLFGHTSNLIQQDNVYIAAVPQHLETEGAYLTFDNIVTSASIFISGYVFTNEETGQPLEVQMKHLTVDEGAVALTILAGSWMKLTPVITQV